MLKDVLKTVASRYVVALLNFLLIVINSKVLGREGIGMVGVIYASANIAVIFNSILCGNTIVYFMNRYNLRYVFFPAYGWACAGSIVACSIMYMIGILPAGYELPVLGLAVLISLVTANTLMLLGKDDIKRFNLTFLLQGVGLFLALVFIYYSIGTRNVTGYLIGLFVANIVAYGYSLFRLLPYLSRKQNKLVASSFFCVLKEMFVYGVWSGLDNLAEGLVNRLNYFLLHRIGGYGYVGLLDAGTKISESVWHISNSTSFIEYNEVSKTTDQKAQKQVTLRLFKLTYCALFLVMALIVCIPEWVYTDYLLTAEFVGIRRIILGLSVGIVALGANRVVCHYFIGSGNIRYSAYSSFLGLAVLLVAGLFLIPAYSVFGAALTTSIAYSIMLIFSLAIFMKQTKTTWIELMPNRDDWAFLKKINKKFV